MSKHDADAELAPGVELKFVSPGPERHFFGYYDKSPLDGTGRRLLCHRTDFDGRMVEEGDQAEVGFWDLDSGIFHPLAKLRAFNWQIGSMLQWLGPDYSRQVVFNDRRDGRFVSVVVDVATGTQREMPCTVYSVAADGRHAVTPRFERHAHCRPGYNYAGETDPSWAAQAPEEDGILLLDVERGETRQIISTRELLQMNPVASMQEGDHYVEHLLFNPSGTRFAFFHRWKVADGGGYTRLYSCDRQGGDLFAYPDSGRYSHGCWRNDEEFVISGKLPTVATAARYSAGFLRQLLGPALRLHRRLQFSSGMKWLHRRAMGIDYLHFIDRQSRSGRVVARGMFEDDGHPNMRPTDGDWMLTDTYPDQQGYQHLWAFHLPTETPLHLGSFFQPPQFRATGYRCDLHPRWDRGGGRVIVDSLASSTRQVYVLDVTCALANALDARQAA